MERGPFRLVRFCMFRLKTKKVNGVPFAIPSISFRGVRLVEQTEQKIDAFVCLKEKQKRKIKNNKAGTSQVGAIS